MKLEKEKWSEKKIKKKKSTLISQRRNWYRMIWTTPALMHLMKGNSLQIAIKRRKAFKKKE
jgi:hypothetical protein